MFTGPYPISPVLDFTISLIFRCSMAVLASQCTGTSVLGTRHTPVTGAAVPIPSDESCTMDSTPPRDKKTAILHYCSDGGRGVQRPSSEIWWRLESFGWSVHHRGPRLETHLHDEEALLPRSPDRGPEPMSAPASPSEVASCSRSPKWFYFTQRPLSFRVHNNSSNPSTSVRASVIETRKDWIFKNSLPLRQLVQVNN